MTLPYRHRIDKTGETGPDRAFHSATPGPSHSAGRAPASHHGSWRQSGPKGRSDHSAGPANRRLHPASRTRLRLGDRHPAEISPTLQPFPPHWFPADQSRNGGKLQRSYPASPCAAARRHRDNRESLWGFRRADDGGIYLMPWRETLRFYRRADTGWRVTDGGRRGKRLCWHGRGQEWTGSTRWKRKSRI